MASLRLLTTRPWLRLAAAGALLSLACLVLAAPQLLYPLWFDQGAFAACSDVLRRGGAMYAACWEVRGPLTPVLYALARAITPAWNGVRALDLVWQWATACALAALAWRMFRSTLAALCAGVLYGLMYASLNYWATAQAEGFSNLLVVLMMIASLGAGERRRAWLLAGVLAGLLGWFKYPFALFGVLPGLIALRHAPHLRVRAVGSLGAGLAAAGLAGIGWLALTGALPDWWRHLQYDLATFHSVPLAERWAWFTGLFRVEMEAFVSHGNTPTAGWKDTVTQLDVLGRGYPWLFAACAVGLARAVLSPAGRRPRLLAAAYLAMAIALNIWQGHSYRYHFVIWLPALALLASSGLPASGPGRASRGAVAARAAAASAVALAAFGMVAAVLPWLLDFRQNVFVEHKDLRVIAGESRQREVFDVADFLRANTGPAESVVVLSDVPAVYALADRPMGTRFPYLRWAEEGRDARITSRYAEDMLADMRASQPRYVVLTKDGYPWPEARFVDVWKGMPAIHDLVERDYRYVTDIGSFIVFERR